ncbi:hypothetical protein Q4601_20130 [Shewanella sp. 1_MG-2023]|jgi:hypothetical protein|uniref:Lipoprotein n=1 Tax=Shewanella electrodiphila TaxID=934143 RepID=A0ABT0KRH8_9GAMM|nr:MULTISPECIES: hypothetical protein [Shewanella]MCC4833114.1 hypothetical protein [Shewanella sp. 10N.7]MCL1046254.1 hypothetical protein [Shewanella electrodiphila]MDO6613274.1 hypothetical protein [Shewanella sp. 7_MG-2023]MDO6773210.1 hypothetical protein [Shewanella sp. 2_MG-2023]MDO6796605.1 hypothetical protein [Shewanella sp. 1_MG-2023]
MHKYFVIFSLLLITACSPAEDSQQGRLEKALSPEQVSIGFFTAIYVERDIEKAKVYVSQELKDIMSHYHIASAVQRHVLGLSMTDVNMSIDDIDIDFFRKFTDEVDVKVKMEGLRGGSPWVDDRTIKLVKNGKRWTIVEVLTEKGRIDL